MDIRFKGASLHYYEQILNTAVTQEDTAESIVPDALPDVSEILMTDGSSFIRGKDVRRSGVSVSGLTELTVLYRTEEGSLGSMPVDIPFETEISFNLPEEAARIVASVRLTCGEARLLNSRKLLLRAEVCITVSVWSPAELRWSSSAEAEGCGVELRSERCCLRPVTAVEEKTFTAEDVLPLPAGSPPAASLLFTRAALFREEAEKVGRKLVVRGSAAVSAVYLTPAGEVASADFSLPWSAFLEFPEEDGEESYSLVTALTGCSGEVREGGIALTVGGVVQAVIRSRRELCLIADAYGTDCLFTPTFTAAEMDEEATPDERTERVIVRLDGLHKPRSIVYLAADCGRPRMEKEGCRLPLTARALCIMEDGSLELLSGRGETTIGGVGSVPELNCADLSASVGSFGVELRASVAVSSARVSGRRLNILTAAEVAPRGDKDRGPAVVLLRTVEGDSVWSLGKKKGVSCAAIRSYNQLAEGEEPAVGSLLLLAR